MKKWVENALTVVIVGVMTVVAVAVCFGFYYLIMIMAKKVFFGE